MASKSSSIELLDEQMVAMLRKKTPAEKIHMASELHQVAREILAAEIKQQHSKWSETRVQKQVAWRLLNNIDLSSLCAADLINNR